MKIAISLPFSICRRSILKEANLQLIPDLWEETENHDTY